MRVAQHLEARVAAAAAPPRLARGELHVVDGRVRHEGRRARRILVVNAHQEQVRLAAALRPAGEVGVVACGHGGWARRRGPLRPLACAARASEQAARTVGHPALGDAAVDQQALERGAAGAEGCGRQHGHEGVAVARRQERVCLDGARVGGRLRGEPPRVGRGGGSRRRAREVSRAASACAGRPRTSFWRSVAEHCSQAPARTPLGSCCHEAAPTVVPARPGRAQRRE